MRFENRVILITGAAGNLGRAVSAAFLKEGGRLVLISREQAELASAFPCADAGRILAAADLTNLQEAQDVVHKALDAFGRVDVLCNLAGGFRMGPAIHETSAQDWNYLYDLNLKTLLNMVQATVPSLLAQGAGKIVNIGAFAATRGVAAMGAYTASKSAVIRITEAMAAELRDNGINVNCVLPTIIDTPENRQAMPDANPAKWVAPQDLASAILFLASDDARAIHGASLPVTGLS